MQQKRLNWRTVDEAIESDVEDVENVKINQEISEYDWLFLPSADTF